MALFSAETKAKIKVKVGKIARGVKDNAGAIFAVATTVAAWKGYSNSKRNARRVNCCLQRTDVLRSAVNNHADCIIADRQKMLELEHRQNELLNKALVETEGKAE